MHIFKALVLFRALLGLVLGNCKHLKFQGIIQDTKNAETQRLCMTELLYDGQQLCMPSAAHGITVPYPIPGFEVCGGTKLQREMDIDRQYNYTPSTNGIYRDERTFNSPGTGKTRWGLQASREGESWEGDLQHSLYTVCEEDDGFCIGKKKEMTMKLTAASGNPFDYNPKETRGGCTHWVLSLDECVEMPQIISFESG